MNDIQRQARCRDCIKREMCEPNATIRIRRERQKGDTVPYYEGNTCKGFLSFTRAKLLIDTETLLNRNLSAEEVLQHYEIKSRWTITKKCRNLGLLGFGFKKGLLRNEYSFLARVLGSWRQPCGGGYFFYDLERDTYTKGSSFRELTEVE